MIKTIIIRLPNIPSLRKAVMDTVHRHAFFKSEEQRFRLGRTGRIVLAGPLFREERTMANLLIELNAFEGVWAGARTIRSHVSKSEVPEPGGNNNGRCILCPA